MESLNKYDEESLNKLICYIKTNKMNTILQLEVEQALNKLIISLPKMLKDVTKNIVKVFPKVENIYCIEKNKNLCILHRIINGESIINNTYTFKIKLKTKSQVLYGLLETNINGEIKNYNILNSGEEIK